MQSLGKGVGPKSSLWTAFSPRVFSPGQRISARCILGRKTVWLLPFRGLFSRGGQDDEIINRNSEQNHSQDGCSRTPARWVDESRPEEKNSRQNENHGHDR